MPNDIIDNQNDLLVDQIRTILGSTDAARFAVGYFFLSGFTALADRLAHLKSLKLLIGNTTNRETLEQIAEGYKRLELVREAAEAQVYPKRTDVKRMATETATNIRLAVEVMDQTDGGEQIVKTLARMIEEKRLSVRVYTKGRLHAKAYIFDYGPSYDLFGHEQSKFEHGVAIVGSSNLTLSGISHNTELNVVVHGNGNHEELGRWFETLWEESQNFDEALMQEIKQSWAMAPVRPYDVYMKALYSLVRDRLEGEDEKDILWDDEIASRLATFQRVAVKQAIQMIRVNGGAFVADVVGLGKSYIGAAVVKHFERTDHARPLILCPKALVEMWERYNEVYQLNARVLSTGYLVENEDGGSNVLLDDVKYRDRDFLLVDESHNFRYPDTQRYKVLEAFLASGRPACFLTATPRNKSAWDVYYQIKLFHQNDKTDFPIDPPNLREYFKLVEKGQRSLRDALSNILIRRTRHHILRWYGFDAETQQPVDPANFNDYLDGKRKAYVIVAGRHQFFPKRELETVEYSIEETYQGLYQKLRGYLGRAGTVALATNGKLPDELTYARYGLWHYVKKEKQKIEPYASLARAGRNLRGLMRILMFKRFESSVYAFQQTIIRMIAIHEHFVDALKGGVVPAGEDAQAILYEPNAAEEQDIVDALRQVSGRYVLADFDSVKLKKYIEHDLNLLRNILALVKPITPDKDAKLQKLKSELKKMPLKEGKQLIFTQYADTADYLYQNLNPGDKRDDIDVIYSGDKSKARAVGRFAPKANPEYTFQSGESELMTLVATDVLAEGLNLQDCDKIINYDLHWNPVRLIQRFGRIDRIGTDHEYVYGFNFLPELGIESNLGLHQRLRNRIQEIHDTIGEDSKILDRTEQLNEEAMYAIYDKKALGSESSGFEEDEFLDLNEAKEILRQLRSDDPAEYERIANLRDGIRTAKSGEQKGMFVFCQAGRYQQLFLLDGNGEITSRDVPRVLGAVKCAPDVQGQALPDGYNAAVMRVKRIFDEEVKQRESERQHTLSLTVGQRYVMRELSVLFRASEDEDQKGQITLLEKAFRNPLTKALQRELNLLRKNGVSGEALLKSLARLYSQHNLRDWLDRMSGQPQEDEYPRIVCSEALV